MHDGHEALEAGACARDRRAGPGRDLAYAGGAALAAVRPTTRGERCVAAGNVPCTTLGRVTAGLLHAREAGPIGARAGDSCAHCHSQAANLRLSACPRQLGAIDDDGLNAGRKLDYPIGAGAEAQGQRGAVLMRRPGPRRAYSGHLVRRRAAAAADTIDARRGTSSGGRGRGARGGGAHRCARDTCRNCACACACSCCACSASTCNCCARCCCCSSSLACACACGCACACACCKSCSRAPCSAGHSIPAAQRQHRGSAPAATPHRTAPAPRHTAGHPRPWNRRVASWQ